MSPLRWSRWSWRNNRSPRGNADWEILVNPPPCPNQLQLRPLHAQPPRTATLWPRRPANAKTSLRDHLLRSNRSPAAGCTSVPHLSYGPGRSRTPYSASEAPRCDLSRRWPAHRHSSQRPPVQQQVLRWQLQWPAATPRVRQPEALAFFAEPKVALDPSAGQIEGLPRGHHLVYPCDHHAQERQPSRDPTAAAPATSLPSGHRHRCRCATAAAARRRGAPNSTKLSKRGRRRASAFALQRAATRAFPCLRKLQPSRAAAPAP
mmetsp:Transcript_26791/g.67428  ORF Transcript_26791/g.67428 Transcript_26791/m.67428 type:complete len:262 (-) Transcript_26791:23-808(-)